MTAPATTPSNADTIRIERLPIDDGVHLLITGSLGLAETHTFETALCPVVASRPRRLVIELDVQQLTSLAIGLLIQSATGVTRRGGRVAVCTANPQVMGVLERVRLSSVIPVFANVDDAVQAVSLAACTTAPQGLVGQAAR